MTRGGYGKDEIYTRMSFASLAEWKVLSDTAGLPIFIPHGVLFFSSKPGDYFSGSIAVHEGLGLPLEQMDGAQLQRRFPMIDFSGIIIGLFEPGFGALMARRAVQTLVRISSLQAASSATRRPTLSSRKRGRSNRSGCRAA